MRHMSSYISSERLIYYISPFSIASYKTWSFFDPRKVLQFHINHKYSCSFAYMIWISDIFLHCISCCIFLWANCSRKWWAEDIHIWNKIDPNSHFHEVDSSLHHQNCLQVYCDSHHNIRHQKKLRDNLQES